MRVFAKTNGYCSGIILARAIAFELATIAVVQQASQAPSGQLLTITYRGIVARIQISDDELFAPKRDDSLALPRGLN